MMKSLPPKTERDVIVPLTEEQISLYRATTTETLADIADNDCGTCVRYVDGSLGSGGTGITWANGFNTIQAGIFSANLATTEVGGPPTCDVWVKEGTYNPTEGGGDDATFLTADDRVLGLLHKGEARAYPLKIMDWHGKFTVSVPRNF